MADQARAQRPKIWLGLPLPLASDAHSIALCTLILEDLLAACPELRDDALADRIVYGINAKHTFPNGKKKTLDLAIGTTGAVKVATRFANTICPGEIDRVLISCEAKTVMTEHGKSQPPVFDELGSSHEIVHQGDRDAIAAGVTVVNIAKTFVSPLRQKSESYTCPSTNSLTLPNEWSNTFAICRFAMTWEARVRRLCNYRSRLQQPRASVVVDRSTVTTSGGPRPLRYIHRALSAAYANRFGS